MTLRAILSSLQNANTAPQQAQSTTLGSNNQASTATRQSERSVMPTPIQAEEALSRLSVNIIEHQESEFERQLRQIDPKVKARQNVYDRPVTLEIARPPHAMTKRSYDVAFARAALKQTGLSDVTDGEAAGFLYDYEKTTGQQFTFTWSERALQQWHAKHGTNMPAFTSEYGLAAADAGMRDIYWRRQARAEADVQQRREAQRWGEEALVGWPALHYNVPVNLINGVTEPVRGVAGAAGVDIPAVPRATAVDDSEYWQSEGRGQVTEAAATLVAGIAVGGPALTTRAGQVVASADAMYNGAVGALGTDPTHRDPETGEWRQMGALERTARITGAVVTTAGVSNQLGAASRPAGSTSASIAEAVTPDGQRMRVPVRDEQATTVNDPLQMKASEANAPYVGRGNRPPYAEGTVARDIVLREARVFVRVHGEGPAGGKWIMRREDIEGLTAQQIKDKFALPSLPKYVSDVHVPAGTHLRVGTVAAQEGWGKGFGTQYELMEQIQSEAFKNRRLLPQ